MTKTSHRLAAIAAVWLLASASPVLAQSGGAARWEIEGYGGVAFPRVLSGGDTTLPPPGPPLTTSSPIFPTRQVPSWFFGDGATLLNDVNGEFGVSSRIEPLDAILGPDGFDTGSAAAFGVRARRRMSPRVSLELSFDVLPESQELSARAREAVEAARASFETAFRGLLATGPFAGSTVQATSASDSSSGRDLAATAALDVTWGASGRFVPYLTV